MEDEGKKSRKRIAQTMYEVNTGCHKAGDDHHTIAGLLCSD